MAPQEITLKFRGDASDIQRVIAALGADLAKLSKAELAGVRNNSRQVVVEATRAERQRVSETIRSANQRLKEEQRAAREVARINAETARQAAAQERIRERAATQLANVQIREARRAAQELERSLRQPRSTSGTSAGGSASLLAGAAGGLTALLGVSAISEIRQAGQAWFEYSSKLEATRIAFTTMLGSAEAASAHLKELQQFALTTPFEFSDLIDASQRMQALGFEAKQVVPILTDVGNAVAAAGGGSERLDRVVLAISQIQSKGKVATQELNQLAEAGIPAWKILEQQFGKSRSELVKLVEQGRISSATFLDAFQRFSQANFGGLMEKQSQTATGALSNIKDAVLQVSNNAFAPLFKMISDGLNSVAKDLQTNQSSWEAWGKNISTSVATSVSAIIALIKSIRDVDQELAKTLNLPEIQKAIDETLAKKQAEVNRDLIVAAALLQQLRNKLSGTTPQARAAEEPQGLARIRLDKEGRVIKDEEAKLTDLLDPNKTNKGRQRDPLADYRRSLALTLRNTLENYNTEEINLKRSLERRTISLESYVESAKEIERRRNLSVLASLIHEAEGIEKIKDAAEKALATQELSNDEATEERRHKEALLKLDDQLLAHTDALAEAVFQFERGQRDQLKETLGLRKTAFDAVREFEAAYMSLGGSLSDGQVHWLNLNASLIEVAETVQRLKKELQDIGDFTPAIAPQGVEITDEQRRGNVLTPEDQAALGTPPDLSLWEQFGVALREIIAGVKFEMISLAEFMTGQFKLSFLEMGDALKQGVVAWLIYGESLGKALRKALATSLAHIAADAAIQALYHLAFAIGKLAFGDAAGASLHFIAAAKFGAVAAAAGIGARLAAGNAFSGTVGGTQGGGSSSQRSGQQTQSSSPKTVELDRASQNQQAITLLVNVKQEPGAIVQVTLDDHRNNGPIRQMILSELK